MFTVSVLLIVPIFSRYVEEIKGLRPESITPIYCIGCKKEKCGLPTSIHAFLFIDLI